MRTIMKLSKRCRKSLLIAAGFAVSSEQDNQEA